MKGDISIAGLLLTAEEWQALDSPARALLAAMTDEEGYGPRPPYAAEDPKSELRASEPRSP